MARGRMIAQTVATDKRLNALSVEAELVYLKTIPQLDRDGLILGEPILLWAKVCPRRPELMDRIEAIIDEWVTSGLVIAYEGEDGPCLYFVGFSKNQTGIRYDREAASVLPIPPGYTRTPSGLAPTEKRPSADELRQNSGQAPDSVRRKSTLKQSKVKEEAQPRSNSNTHTPTPESEPTEQPTPQQELFEAVCQAIGSDYHTLTKEDRGQIAQTCGILSKANYTHNDILQFMQSVWFKDWRWTEKQSYPTLNQLRKEIGKVRGASPPADTEVEFTLEQII